MPEPPCGDLTGTVLTRSRLVKLGSMTNGDMRNGHCGACGAHEVHRGEYAAQGGIRSAGSLMGRHTVFDAYVCADCGHTQLHVQLDSGASSRIRRKLQWIPPRQDLG